MSILINDHGFVSIPHFNVNMNTVTNSRRCDIVITCFRWMFWLVTRIISECSINNYCMMYSQEDNNIGRTNDSFERHGNKNRYRGKYVSDNQFSRWIISPECNFIICLIFTHYNSYSFGSMYFVCARVLPTSRDK